MHLKWFKFVVIFLMGLMAVIGYLNDVHGFYGNYIEQRRAEDGLELMNAGVSISHVESVFGSPVSENHDNEKGLFEYIYSFDKFYLQVVFNKNNTVIFFAVTSKDRGFEPKIPYLNGNLGSTFVELSGFYSENVARIGSKYFEYNENIYGGNPWNYRNVYLAYNPAGVDYGRMEALPRDEIPYPSRMVSDQFRNKSHPNTYGVGSIHGGRESGELNFGIGIEYFSSRDLPEHRY